VRKLLAQGGLEAVELVIAQGPGGKWQISTGGGRYPIWSSNGREPFYETPDNRIMVSAYTAKGDSFAADKPRLWSTRRSWTSSVQRYGI
jgi:hypothetical protein